MQPHTHREVRASTWDGGSLRARSSTPELCLPSPSVQHATFKVLRRVLPANEQNRSDLSLLFHASIKAESEIPMHKKQ